jgi:hypothetical protein
MTVAAPEAVQRAAAPPAGRVLKLYVDSTSLSLVHQMADFVACADQPEVVKLITWLRLPLAPEQLAGCNASYVPQLAAVSPQFVATVAAAVKRHLFDRIELHANQYHAWRGVVPLLQAIVPLLRDARETLRLHLYDDGTVGLVQRESLKALPDAAAALAAGAADLRAAVLQRQPLRWGIAQSYAWQHLFETRYHMLRRDVLLRDAPGRALHALFAPIAQDMAFDGLPQLSDAQSARYLGLFGLDAEVADRLAPVAGRSDALLFTGSSAWDPAQNKALADTQVRAIGALREGGCLPPEWRIAFKGHPANADQDHRLVAALGDDVVVLPARVPLEVLAMAGLLPARVAGVMSSIYCTLPPGAIEYLLCRRCAVEGGAGSALVDLMLATGMVTADRLLPMLD